MLKILFLLLAISEVDLPDEYREICSPVPKSNCVKQLSNKLAGHNLYGQAYTAVEFSKDLCYKMDLACSEWYGWWYVENKTFQTALKWEERYRKLKKQCRRR